ncbi:MAG: DUF934 domain-containing protein [Halioglobus sp.]|nr:DUF934 domain-containing protein [Halioglobus sp.]
MPRLIKDGAVIDDRWQPIDLDSDAPRAGQIASLEQWLNLADKAGTGVQLEPAEEPDTLFPHLHEIALIVINFPVFTDGRGFSYARRLREHGYRGELRAGGHFIRDQLTYLRRCGFDAFQMADESGLEAALASLSDFTEFYQAAEDQPLPLFRRRAEPTS